MSLEGLDLKSLEAVIAELSDEDRRDLVSKVEGELRKPFRPNPGPQTVALDSLADILLYGGQAGGGKSALEVGAAANNHYSSLILRREATQLDGLIEFSKEILSAHGEFVGGNENVWKLKSGGRIKFAGLKQPDDWRKHAGNAKDYLAFDEAAEFLREQVFSLIGWLRTTREGQRCRVILGSNPPRGADGLWIIEEFAPWLDKGFPNPAAPGELRWAIVVGGVTEWVDGPGVYERNGEEYEALSRTFIPASLSDNPYIGKEYRAKLQSLPEPLRSQLLYGDFLAGREDDEFQVFPSAWLQAAQDRWKPDGYQGLTMSALAVDVAQGGPDNTTLAPRYGAWFAPLVVKKGAETPDGPSVAGLIVGNRRDQAPIIVDMGGGYGGSTVDTLKGNGIDTVRYNGSEASNGHAEGSGLAFVNKRAEVHWRFREALNPDQEGGSPIALPPDPMLIAELAAVRWKLTARGIQIEDKLEIRKRIGRSPDRGDGVVTSWSEGQKAALRKLHSKALGLNGRMPKVIVAYANHKRKRR